MSKFSEILKALRLDKQLTQEQLAEILGVSPQAVSRWETAASYPDITLLPAIASYFETTVDELLGLRKTVKKQKMIFFQFRWQENADTSEDDFIHRSWTIAYFNDVHIDPYVYQDKYKTPWDRVRNGRLGRLSSKKRKDIRLRILDIPILYCFYVSRNWEDVNVTDLEKIKEASINDSEYSKEEIVFLKEQKEKLVVEYEEALNNKLKN